MEYTFWKNLKLSRLCLGTVQIGRPYGIANTSGKPDKDLAFSIFNTAIDQGINIFDTAISYGDSEALIGQYITQMPSKKQSPTIITKIPQLPKEITDKESIQKFFFQEVENSLERLKLKQIPLFLLHSAPDILKYGSVITDIFNELKKKKKILYAGVSIYSVEDVNFFLKCEDLDVIQVPFNIFDSKLYTQNYLQKLKEKEILILSRSVFLQGLFFLNEEQLKVKIPNAIEPMKNLIQLSQELHISIENLALGFVKHISEISTILFGAELPEQVIKNVNNFNQVHISDDIFTEIVSKFKDIPESITNPSLWKK